MKKGRPDQDFNIDFCTSRDRNCFLRSLHTNVLISAERCEHKYDKTVFIAIMESFDCLPLGALVNGKFLALHGGISPELRSTNLINSVNRFEEPPRQGIFCDILWADPVRCSNKPLGTALPPRP